MIKDWHYILHRCVYDFCSILPNILFLILVYLFAGGFKGGKNVIIEPHRHEGVFIARGKEDALVTLNMVPGEAVYGEKRISVEVSNSYKYVRRNVFSCQGLLHRLISNRALH
jgi:hypothetical protein